MEKLILTYEGKKADPYEFETFLSLNNVSLPIAFKAFLLQHENSETKLDTFRNQYTINRFLGLKSNINASIETVFYTYLEEFETSEYFPFAIDSGGWIFVLSLNRSTYGQIFIDTLGGINPKTFEKIAPSFENFIDELTDGSVDELKDSSKISRVTFHGS